MVVIFAYTYEELQDKNNHVAGTLKVGCIKRIFKQVNEASKSIVT
jgi:hypothetical protein